MSHDPITTLQRDHLSVASSAYGEHSILEVARHVADARARRVRRRGLIMGHLLRSAAPTKPRPIATVKPLSTSP